MKRHMATGIRALAIVLLAEEHRFRGQLVWVTVVLSVASVDGLRRLMNIRKSSKVVVRIVGRD